MIFDQLDDIEVQRDYRRRYARFLKRHNPPIRVSEIREEGKPMVVKLTNLASLKRALAIPNVKIRVLSHWKPNLIGTTRTPKATRKNGKPGVQTNGYWWDGPKADGTVVEMWCTLPKLKELHFEPDGSVTFYPGTDRPWKLLFETPEPPPDFKARAAGDDTLKELAVLDAIDEQQAGPEARLRALWNAKGVPKERQEAILADITAKAQPGAMVGPFRIGGPPPALPGMDGHLEAQRKAAGERQGESLTEKFNRPPADVSAKAGELERKGQLFRDTEASGQGKLF